jgi:two-component system, cell cycle response regulator DivK
VTRTAPTSGLTGPAREILFIEDDEGLRELLAATLREAGFSVVETPGAEMAVGHLRRHTPDLIVLDLGMPPGRMSGTELLAELREAPEWARIPVIVVSGFGDLLNPDIVTGLGVRAVFVKPEVSGAVLVDTSRRILGG